MTVQPAKTLEQQVNGAKLGDHPVEIEIQALLNDLGGDQNTPWWAIAILTPATHDCFLNPLAVFEAVTGVKQHDFLIGSV